MAERPQTGPAETWFKEQSGNIGNGKGIVRVATTIKTEVWKGDKLVFH